MCELRKKKTDQIVMLGGMRQKGLLHATTVLVAATRWVLSSTAHLGMVPSTINAVGVYSDHCRCVACLSKADLNSV